ncbi:MAG: hypothetical protein LBP40_07470, partial [Campylobacteraceae bacterium]|nr:hypothetical protein [Campylobacteraceae bacterium]
MLYKKTCTIGGEAEDCYLAGLDYKIGNDIKKMRKRLLSYLKRRASLTPLYGLAELYIKGQGCKKKDVNKAIEYYDKASSVFDSSSCYEIA